MRLLAIIIGCAAYAPFADAAPAQSLDWSYTYASGNVISGVFTGTDAGNDFTVTGLPSFSVNGVETNYLAGATIGSVDALFGFGSGFNGNGTAVVTLDGSYMDLIVTPDSAATGFDFAVGDAYAANLGINFAAYTIPAVGKDQDVPFKAAKWSAALVGNQVPEPATATILLAGLVGLGITRRRKAA